MNRNLAIFSLLLILVGLAFGLYLIAFFGFLLIIPAFLVPQNPPGRPPRAPPPPAPRRITPPAETKPEPVAAPPSQEMAMPSPSYSSSSTMQQTYSPALFPSPMLPSLSQVPGLASAQPPKEASAMKQEGSRDELVEMGAILALLKLAFG